MEFNKIVRIIWKCNSILIFFIGLLVIIQMIPTLYEKIVNFKQDNSNIGVDVVTPNETNNAEFERKYGSIKHINGSNIRIVPLLSDKISATLGPNFNNFSSPNYAEINHLFVDTISHLKHWLFAENNQVIFEYTLLSQSIDDKQIDMAILYSVILQDTNDDKRLDSLDLKSIALSKIDGTNYTHIVSNIDTLVDHEIVNSDNLFIIYRTKNDYKTITVSLNDFKIIESSELPKI